MKRGLKQQSARGLPWVFRSLGIGLVLGLFLGTVLGVDPFALWVPVKRGAWVAQASRDGATESVLEGEFCRFGLRLRGKRQCLNDFAALARVIPAWQLPVEQGREQLSEWVRESDSMAVFRRLILDESCARDWVELQRLLGWVHIYSAAGVHLDAFSRFFEGLGEWSWRLIGLRLFPASLRAAQIWRAVAEAGRWLSLALLWLLSGLRWGLVRPLIGLELGRALGGAHTRVPFAGFKLLFSLALDALLSFEVDRRLSPGFGHYATAVAGGILGWVAYRHLRQKVDVSWESHLWLAVGSWLVPVVAEALAGERFPVALATPLLSCLSIPFLSLLYLPGLLGWACLALMGAPEMARLGGLAWNHATNELFRICTEALLQLPQLGSLSSEAVFLGLFGALLGRCLYLARRSPRVWKLGVLAGLFFGGTLRGVLPDFFETELQAQSHPELKEERARVVQLNIGQGDAAWIRTESGRTGFWDVGGERAWSPVRWLRFAMRERISRLDFIAFSHFDEDHAGGVRRLLRLFSVGCLAWSEEADRGDPRARALGQWLKSTFPPAARPRLADFGSCFPAPVVSRGEASLRGPPRPNSLMAAAWVPLVDGGAWVSLGDADERLERRFLPWLTQQRAHEPGPLILKLSHHGSRTSTAPELLARLRPQEVWISAGRRNRFGHPSPGVLARLRAQGLRWRWTAREGDLSR